MKSIFSRNILVAAVLCGLNASVHAAGFALANQAGSGTGNAFAGNTAVVEDASIAWLNPAGMTELKSDTHISTSAHLVMPKAQFTNDGSTLPGAGTADGGKNGVVPGVYVVHRLNDKMSAGLSVNVPFGLGTEYSDNWVGRAHALESTIKTLNINPSIAYKVNDQLSVGAGISAQSMEVKLKSVANPAIGATATIAGKDDVSVGGNVGLLYKPTEKTQIGLHYRSGIDHKLKGTVKFDSPLTALNDNVTADADLPAHASLSVGHKVNDKLEVMGDVTRTKWSSYERIRVVKSNGVDLSNEYQGWKDANRYAIGANYQYSERLKLRGGIALDESPVPNAQLRSPRTPDNDRTWVAVGANYKVKKNFDVDVAYTHISTKSTPIENTKTIGANNFLLKGNYDSKVDVVGVQLNWAF